MSTKKRPAIPVFTFLLFGLIALFSTAALEYLKSKQKGSSPTLIPLFEKNRNSPTNKNIEQIIKEQLSSIGVSPESIHKYKDNKNNLHMLIKIPRGKYSTIELPIEDAILANHASIVKKEELYDESIDYFLWKIVGKEDQKIMLLFSCKKDVPKKSTELETPINKVAVIMDDMGYSLKAISDICSIKKPITISILPFSPFAQETAQIAHKNKLEIILHLPLESNHDKGGNIRTKGIIRSNMNEDEIVKILDTNFSQVPFVKGANNHMGSKITADKNYMEIILKYFKAKNFFFIDSVTTEKSTAYE
ncbi:MAG: divergent polysaccharide deacetylase family protein, partial [Candidatus Aminicenantaceae bacterium]